MGHEYEDLKYLRIPKGRIYEASDWFSRVDEELEQVIRGLDLVASKLDTLTTALTGMTPERIREYYTQVTEIQRDFTQQIMQMQSTVIKELKESVQQWMQMLPAQITGNIISIPAKVDIYDQRKYSIDDSKWTEVNLHGDIIVITADDDVYYSKTTGMTGFILRSGAYLVITRSEELDKLYFKAVVGSTSLYIQELLIKQE